jgi:hypothetical protein
MTFDEVAAALSRETGDPVRHVRVTPDQVRSALASVFR